MAKIYSKFWSVDTKPVKVNVSPNAGKKLKEDFKKVYNGIASEGE